MTEEDILSVDQAAQILKINRKVIRKLCNNGELACYRPTPNRIIFSTNHIQRFLEDKECPKKTKVNTFPSEKTGDGGEFSNTSTESGFGMLAASLAEERLRSHLQNEPLQKENVIRMKSH